MGSPEDVNYSAAPRTQRGAAHAYRVYDGCAASFYSTSTTEPDISGGNTSKNWVWRRTGGAANPEVVIYRDPNLNHTNFTGANRYFDESDVWDFFKAHPRVT